MDRAEHIVAGQLILERMRAFMFAAGTTGVPMQALPSAAVQIAYANSHFLAALALQHGGLTPARLAAAAQTVVEADDQAAQQVAAAAQAAAEAQAHAQQANGSGLLVAR